MNMVAVEAHLPSSRWPRWLWQRAHDGVRSFRTPTRFTMTVLAILGVLVAIAALGGGAYAVNDYARRTYDYNAFCVPNLTHPLIFTLK